MANTTWEHVGTLNDISSIMTEEEKAAYKKKMYKLGLKLAKMKPNKPKLKKKENKEVDSDIESIEKKATKEAEKEEISRKHDKNWF